MDDRLEQREGLPAHLRVLAEKYPRSGWKAHSNFDEMTGFWLDRHLMFRDLISRLQHQSEAYLDQPYARFAPELSRYTGFFLTQLHGHHSIEDDHYFPQFIKLDQRLEHGFALLDRDHHALDRHIQALAAQTNAVLAAVQANQDAKIPTDRLLSAQRDFDRFLQRHLCDEEDIIVPLVLEYAPALLG